MECCFYEVCDRQGLAPAAPLGASPRRSQGCIRGACVQFFFAAGVMECGLWLRPCEERLLFDEVCDRRGLAPAAPLGANPRRPRGRIRGLVSGFFSPPGFWNVASGLDLGRKRQALYEVCDRRGRAPAPPLGVGPRRPQGRIRGLLSNFFRRRDYGMWLLASALVRKGRFSTGFVSGGD